MQPLECVSLPWLHQNKGIFKFSLQVRKRSDLRPCDVPEFCSLQGAAWHALP
jgi:hypothetical protein